MKKQFSLSLSMSLIFSFHGIFAEDSPYSKCQALCGLFPQNSIITNSSFRGFQSSRRRTRRAFQQKNAYESLMNSIKILAQKLQEPVTWKKEELILLWKIGRLINSPHWKNENSSEFLERLSLDTHLSQSLLKSSSLFFLHFKEIALDLSWEIYSNLSEIPDDRERTYYFRICIAEKWKIDELQKARAEAKYKQLGRSEVNDVLEQKLDLYSPLEDEERSLV